MEIRSGGLDDPAVIALLRIHLQNSRAEAPPESVHALDLDQLRGDGVEFWTIWEGGELLGMGAAKRLADDHYEVKSMHTVQPFRRRGAGSAMLRHIIAFARARGATRLSLETGSSGYYRPAIELYRRHGFVECEPFDGYVPDPNSVFMTRRLTS
jgi:putative acetyltransferase